MKPPRFCCLLMVLAVSVRAETNIFPAFNVETGREYLLTVSQAFQAQAGTNGDTYFLQAQIQSQLGRKDEAERLARLALSCGTNRADIDLFVANLCIRQDRLPEAAECLRAAVQIQPAIPMGHAQLGMILDRLGDCQGAERAFVEDVRLNPENATARLLLGRLLLDQGQVEEALVQLQRSCQLDPDLANGWYALYQAQTKHGDTEAAQKALRTFEQLKQKEQAAMDTENAATDNTRGLRSFAASFHVAAAALLSREGQEAPAEAYLVQATRIAPEEPQAYEKLAELYLKKEQWPSARRMLEELTRLRPNRAAYGVNLGTVLLQLKDLPAAVTEFKRVLEINPKEPAVLNNLARVYLGARRELPEALVMCQKLVASDPKGANYDLLGWAFYANGRTNEAIEASATAVEKEPGNALYQERYRRIRQVAGANR